MSIYHASRSLLSRALRIFVESAALYSLNNLLYIILFSTDLTEEAWLSGLVSTSAFSCRLVFGLIIMYLKDAPVASITFSLIIIRLESAVNTPTDRLSQLPTTQLDSERSSSVPITTSLVWGCSPSHLWAFYFSGGIKPDNWFYLFAQYDLY